MSPAGSPCRQPRPGGAAEVSQGCNPWISWQTNKLRPERTVEVSQGYNPWISWQANKLRPERAAERGVLS